MIVIGNEVEQVLRWRVLEVLRASNPELVATAEAIVAQGYGTCTCGHGPWSKAGICGSCGGLEAAAVEPVTPNPQDVERLAKVMQNMPAAPPDPVDWDARTTTAGEPLMPEHLERDPRTGQQRAYVVLTAEERAKGFVRPVRRTYQHQKCGALTTMGQAIAETYAREPRFYSGTFCVECRDHFPVGEAGEFIWVGTTEKVGT